MRGKSAGVWDDGKLCHGARAAQLMGRPAHDRRVHLRLAIPLRAHLGSGGLRVRKVTRETLEKMDGM